MRTPITTTLTGRGPLQSDLGYILDDILQIITDDLGNRILFHNGIFYDKPTILSGRTGVTTGLTGRTPISTIIT